MIPPGVNSRVSPRPSAKALKAARASWRRASRPAATAWARCWYSSLSKARPISRRASSTNRSMSRANVPARPGGERDRDRPSLGREVEEVDPVRRAGALARGRLDQPTKGRALARAGGTEDEEVVAVALDVEAKGDRVERPTLADRRGQRGDVLGRGERQGCRIAATAELVARRGGGPGPWSAPYARRGYAPGKDEANAARPLRRSPWS